MRHAALDEGVALRTEQVAGDLLALALRETCGPGTAPGSPRPIFTCSWSNPSTAPTRSIRSSVASSFSALVIAPKARLISRSSRWACWASSCQWALKTALVRGSSVFPVLEPREVVQLREPFDRFGQQEDGADVLAEHHGRDFLLVVEQCERKPMASSTRARIRRKRAMCFTSSAAKFVSASNASPSLSSTAWASSPSSA